MVPPGVCYIWMFEKLQQFLTRGWKHECFHQHATWKYSHGVGQSRYHVVLVPYKRFEMFGRTDVQIELGNIFVVISNKHRFEILEQEIVEDHVHMFISIRPSQSMAEIMQYLKGASSRHLRQVFPEMKGFSSRYLWSKGKFFRPISEVNEETIRQYITESQGKHKHPRKARTAKSPWQQWDNPDVTKTPQLTLDAFAS